MGDSERDLESYVLKALAAMQKQGQTPGNILVKTSPQDITLIIRSKSEPIRFGDWSAITISHKDFQALANIYQGILKGSGKKLE